MGFFDDLIAASLPTPQGGSSSSGEAKALTVHQTYKLLNFGDPDFTDAMLAKTYDRDAANALFAKGEDYRAAFKAKSEDSLNPVTGAY